VSFEQEPPACSAPCTTAAEQPAARERRLSARHWIAQYSVVATMVMTFAAFCVLRPDSFFTVFVFKSILRDCAPTLILSLGVTFVLVMNAYDLSLGGAIALCATVAVLLASSDHAGLGTAPAVALTLAFGLALGLINGVLVAYLALPSFILTIATGTIFVGVSLQLTGSSSIFEGIPAPYIAIAGGEILGVSNQVFIAAGALLASHILLRYTQAGLHMYAIGSNAEAARQSGINTQLLQALGFGLVGLAAAIGGILLTSEAGAANPNTGVGLLLPAYAAAFLGACMGGAGLFTAIGTALGALYLQVVGTGLTVLNLSGSTVLTVEGVILGAAVLLARLNRR
jgi:ribose transport system permease protein